MADLTADDWNLVWDKLVALRSASPYASMLDVRKTYNHLQSEFHTQLIDGYLVSCAVTAPWFSTELVLAECMILKLYPGGNVKSALAHLEEVARANNCKQVVVGTFLARKDEALARVYQRHGYSTSLHQLTKEIT